MSARAFYCESEIVSSRGHVFRFNTLTDKGLPCRGGVLKERQAFLVCTIAGLLSFGMVGVLLVIYPVRVPSAETAFLPPALALQFATSRQDILAIFGASGSTERQAITQSMLMGNRVDYGFMAIYAVFLALFFHGQRLKTDLRAWWTVIPMIALVLVFDALENQVLSHISLSPDGPMLGRQLLEMQLFSWAKWSMLAVISAVAAMAFLARGAFVLGALCLPPLLLVLPAYQSPGTSAVYLVLGVGLSWIVMLAHAIKRSQLLN